MLILVKNDQANIRKTRDASTTAVANAEQSAGPQGEALRSEAAALRAGSVPIRPPQLATHTHTLTLTLTLALALALALTLALTLALALALARTIGAW